MSRTALNARTSVAFRLIGAGRFDAARPYQQAAVAAMRAVGGPNDVRAALTEAHHTGWSFASGSTSFPEADAAYERAFAVLRAQSWKPSPRLVANLQVSQGLRAPRWDKLIVRSRVTMAASLAQRSEEGLAQFTIWLPRLAARSYDAHPDLAHWRAHMGLCAIDVGQVQRGRDTSALASAAIGKQAGISAHLKAPVLELERRLSTR